MLHDSIKVYGTESYKLTISCRDAKPNLIAVISASRAAVEVSSIPFYAAPENRKHSQNYNQAMYEQNKSKIM